MQKESKKTLYTSLIMIIAFVLWTNSLYFVDVKPIGPQESKVGFATINAFVHNLLGTKQIGLDLYL